MRRSASAVFLAAALAAVLYATLSPASPIDLPMAARLRWHPVPGDLLRNLVLFVPLGAAWVARGAATRTAVAGALALAVLLEIVQLAIPGRYASPWDALGNTAGAWVGARLARDAWRWRRPSPSDRVRLALAAGALAAGWIALGGWIASPSPPAGDYFAHWTPSLPHLAPIDATLRGAWLDGTSLPHGRLADADRLRRVLAGDLSLRLEAVAGRPTRGLAALLWLTNEDGREVLLVGVERSDLVLRWPGRGAPLGLAAAPLRLPDFFERLRLGAPFELLLTRRGAESCVALGGDRICGLGHTVGDGWRLLASELRLAPRVREGLAAAWIGALWLPIGYGFALAAAPLAAVAAAAAATLVTPRFAGLLPTPWWQLTAAALGFALGLVLQRRRPGSAAGAAT
jgi:hypothetical protein